MYNDDFLHSLSKNLMNDVRKVMEATKSHTVPKTDKEKRLAALAAPKDKITHADVMVGRRVVRKEEAELHELSDTTRNSYVQKSMASRSNASETSTGGYMRAKHPGNISAADNSTIRKRNTGLDLAARVRKEEAELHELSRATLGSYAKKAIKDAPEQDRRGDAYSKMAAGTAKDADRAGARFFGRAAATNYTKAANRRTGAALAIDKLSEEDFNDTYDIAILDEDYGIGSVLDISESTIEVMFNHGIELIDNDIVLEDIENLSELSIDTLRSYQTKAKNDPAFDFIADQSPADRKAIQAKRTAGMASAATKLKSMYDDKFKQQEKQHAENVQHVRTNIGDVLKKKGFTHMVAHPKRDVFVKPNEETGHVITATVHHPKENDSHEPQVMSLSNSSGWQSSDDRHSVSRHPMKQGSDWQRDYSTTHDKKSALEAVGKHIDDYHKQMNERGAHMYESTQSEYDQDLQEAKRGRPKKGAVAGEEEEPAALGYQLRKATSINKPVHFMNGEKVTVKPEHVTKFEDHMDARKSSKDKQDFQNRAHQSHAAFVKAVSETVPTKAKDTGEIVRYR